MITSACTKRTSARFWPIFSEACHVNACHRDLKSSSHGKDPSQLHVRSWPLVRLSLAIFMCNGQKECQRLAHNISAKQSLFNTLQSTIGPNTTQKLYNIWRQIAKLNSLATGENMDHHSFTSEALCRPCWQDLRLQLSVRVLDGFWARRGRSFGFKFCLYNKHPAGCSSRKSGQPGVQADLGLVSK